MTYQLWLGVGIGILLLILGAATIYIRIVPPMYVGQCLYIVPQEGDPYWAEIHIIGYGGLIIFNETTGSWRTMTMSDGSKIYETEEQARVIP